MRLKDAAKGDIAEWLYNVYWETGRGVKKPFSALHGTRHARWLAVADAVRDQARAEATERE